MENKTSPFKELLQKATDQLEHDDSVIIVNKLISENKGKQVWHLKRSANEFVKKNQLTAPISHRIVALLDDFINNITIS